MLHYCVCLDHIPGSFGNHRHTFINQWKMSSQLRCILGDFNSLIYCMLMKHLVLTNPHLTCCLRALWREVKQPTGWSSGELRPASLTFAAWAACVAVWHNSTGASPTVASPSACSAVPAWSAASCWSRRHRRQPRIHRTKVTSSSTMRRTYTPSRRRRRRKGWHTVSVLDDTKHRLTGRGYIS